MLTDKRSLPLEEYPLMKVEISTSKIKTLISFAKDFLKGYESKNKDSQN